VDAWSAVILVAVLAAVSARQLLFRGPPVWILFLVGGLAMVLSGVLTSTEAIGAVAANLSLLAFLWALFVFAAALEQAGALDRFARWLLGRARDPSDLPLLLFIGFGLASALLVNDALVLVGVPLLLSLSRRRGIPSAPLLLTLAYAVTVGSVMTPFGNPQNLLVALGSGLQAPVATFLRYLLLPTLINLVVGGLYVRRVFGRQVVLGGGTPAHTPMGRIPLVPWHDLSAHARRFPVLVIFPATLVLMIGLDLASLVGGGPSVPLALVAVGGAILVLLASRGAAAVFARVDWSILALFVGLFVVMAGVVAGGLIGALSTAVPVPSPGAPGPTVGVVLLTSLGGSQLVSNVPWVALQIPVLRHLGYGGGTPLAWMALAAGSTLAGNLTLIGAASNMIVVEQADRAGVRITLGTFVRYGVPLTLMTSGILFACLWAGV
jgi:Na+/H+ antiporter NhaD/arsenite permease-like protein